MSVNVRPGPPDGIGAIPGDPSDDSGSDNMPIDGGANVISDLENASGDDTEDNDIFSGTGRRSRSSSFFHHPVR